MADLASLRISVDSRTVKTGKTDLDELGRSGEEAERKVTKSTQRINAGFAAMQATIAQAARVLASVALAREFVQMADAAAQLNARLKLATDSLQAYAQAQKDVYRIAQQNLAGVRETAELYTKLLDPVNRLGGSQREVVAVTQAFAASLRVSGSSAQQASAAILQFAQAMGSGVLRGDEFNSIAENNPRIMRALADGLGVPVGALREMAAEGKLTADVVGNALVSQLGKLNAEAAQLPATVGGAFQQLKNDVLIAVDAVNQASGITGALADGLSSIALFIKEITPLLTSFGKATGESTLGFDLMAFAIRVVGTAIEAFMLLASDLVFVAKSVGREIGGIGAQIGALMRGDMEAFRSIRQMMLEDAEKARKELDAYQARVSTSTDRALQARAALKSLEGVDTGAEDARLLRQAGGYKKLTSTVKELTDAQKEQLKAEKRRLEFIAGNALKAIKDYEAAEEAANKERTKRIEDAAKDAQKIEDQVKAQRLQNEELGLSKEALIALQVARLEDAAAEEMRKAAQEYDPEVRKEIERRAQAYRELAKAKAEGGVRSQELAAEEAARKSAEEFAKEWQRTVDQIGDALAQEIMRGGKNAGQLLKNYFKTIVLQPIIKAIVNPVAGAITGALGLGSTAVQAGQGASALGNLGGVGSVIGAFGSSLGAGFTSTIASGFATTGLALEGGLAMVAEGTMASMAAGFGQIAGALGPYALAAAAVYSLYRSLDKSGTPHQGGAVTSSGMGFSAIDQFGGNRLVQTESMLGPLADASAKALNMMSMLAGGANNLSVALSFAADGVDESIGTINIAGQTLRNLKFSNNVEQAMKEFTGELGIGLRAAILTMDLPKWIADQFALLRVDASVEDVAKLVDSINAQVTATRSLKAAFDGLPGSFAAVANLPDELRLKIVEMFGGAQNAIQAANTYFEAFYSEAERTQAATNRMQSAFASLGLEVPKSREAFRALVDSLSLADDKSRATYAALIQLAPAFAELNPLLEQAAEAVQELGRSAENIARERLGLERELLQLQGDTAALRALDRAAIDASNVALFDHINALRDEQDAAQAAAQAAQRVAAEREGLEARLLQAQGNTTALRERELAALNPSNRSLLNQIFALEDAKVAQDEYNRALSEAESRLSAAQSAVQSAQSAVDAVRERGTSQYLSALEKVNTIQERIANSARQVGIEFGRIANELFAFVRETSQAPSQQFSTALRAALGGDQDAMRSLPGLAGGAIEASTASARTATEAARERARILVGVQQAAALAESRRVAEADEAKSLQDELKAAQKDLTEALRVANAIGAPLTRKLDDLVGEFKTAQTALIDAIKERDAAQAALDKIVSNTALTAANLETLRQEGFVKIAALLEFAADATGLPQDLRDLVKVTSLTLTRTLDFIVGTNKLTDDLKKIALTTTNTLTTTVTGVLASDLPSDVKKMALNQTNTITTTVGAVLASDVGADLKRVVLDQAGAYSITVKAIKDAALPEDIKRALFSTTGDFTATIKAIADSSLSEENKKLLLLGNAEVAKTVTLKAALAAQLTADQIKLLDQAASEVTKTVTAAISGGSLNADQRLILEQAAQTVTKTVTGSIDISALTAEQKKFLGLTGTTTGSTVTVSGSVTFDPGNALKSVFDNISATNELLYKSQVQFLRQLLGISGADAKALINSDTAPTLNSGGFTGTYSLLFLMESHLKTMRTLFEGTGARVKFDRGTSAGGSVYAKGGAFTNRIVTVPTMFNDDLMGEAGPEAIMPLTRGPDGSLGVQAYGSSGGGSDALTAAEVAALRAEMRQVLFEIAKQSKRSAETLRSWDDDGRMNVRVEQDPGETVNVKVIP